MQLLSSKYTFFYKYIFVFIWLLGFGVGAREVIFIAPLYDLKWVEYTASWVGIALLIYFMTGSVKQVKLNAKKKQLEISNFIKSDLIDIAEVEDVSGSKYLSPKLVWITLKKGSCFGKKITFMPANRPSRSIGIHPLVFELRKEFKLDSGEG